MPAHCATCEHSERSAIDAALVTGAVSMRELARLYGMHRTSLSRHKAQHLAPVLGRMVAEREEAGPGSALNDLRELRRRALGILDAAETDGKASLSLAALRELRGIVELTAKVTGELDERPQVNNWMVDPGWQAAWGRFTERLLTILEEHAPPAVEERVLHELRELRATEPPTPPGARSLGGLDSVAHAPRGGVPTGPEAA